MSLQDKIAKAHAVREIPPSEYLVPYKSIGDLLQKQAEKFAGKPWLIYYPEDGPRIEFSYRQFYNAVSTAANFLLSLGIQRGDRIATVSYNHSDTIVQYFAAFLIGAVVVPINVSEDDKRIGYILKNSETKVAFARECYLERIDRILKESSLDMRVVKAGEEQIVGVRSELPPFPSPTLDDEALIVYTSGTTGNPKGVVLTQYNLLCDAKAITDWHGMTPDQRMMCVLPIHHVNGTVVTIMTPMYYGGSIVLNQKFHSHKFFESVSAEKVSVVSVVPTLLQFLLHENLEMSTYDLKHFRHIICGAGPLTVELAAAFEKRFQIPIIHGYGLSETTCYSCFLPLDLAVDEHTRWLAEYGFPSIGVPLPSNEMSIHDEQGRELPEGAKGEIVVRGHNVMKEYFANREANETAFAFHWFRSGDEGFYKTDATGRKFFFITGRLKELIIRGGINISPFEIDEILMNMPGVKAGLAVGFENDWYGEEVGAYVQPKEGVNLSEADVLHYCRLTLPFPKSPKVVVFGNEVPVTSTGKYQRNKLKPLFEKWKQTQFRRDESKSKK
ncbi:MAG TPA: class I adenylate-forming enzyme family protein [Bacteroidota bacterium]|nr:class I adenylate-forming enzyme family protein [Bacteroidota bacterium]